MTKWSLISAFDLMPGFQSGTNFTRSDLKTNSFTLIDGILISDNLSHYVSNVRISDYGNNVSDHCPVELDLEAALDEIRLEKKFPKPTVNWAKLSPECIENFQKIMSQKLDEINLSFLSLLHGDRCCSNNHHRESIDRYHNDIVEAVLFSDNSLPRTNFRYHKSYWSSSLNELKQRPIECCHMWRLCGCPKSGDI